MHTSCVLMWCFHGSPLALALLYLLMRFDIQLSLLIPCHAISSEPCHPLAVESVAIILKRSCNVEDYFPVGCLPHIENYICRKGQVPKSRDSRDGGVGRDDNMVHRRFTLALLETRALLQNRTSVFSGCSVTSSSHLNPFIPPTVLVNTSPHTIYSTCLCASERWDGEGETELGRTEGCLRVSS